MGCCYCCCGQNRESMRTRLLLAAAGGDGTQTRGGARPSHQHIPIHAATNIAREGKMPTASIFEAVRDGNLVSE